MKLTERGKTVLTLLAFILILAGTIMVMPFLNATPQSEAPNNLSDVECAQGIQRDLQGRCFDEEMSK